MKIVLIILGIIVAIGVTLAAISEWKDQKLSKQIRQFGRHLNSIY